MRLFLAPGMGHCRGGPGVDTFDTLAALEQWRERDVAPDADAGDGPRVGPRAAHLRVSGLREVRRLGRPQGRRELELRARNDGATRCGAAGGGAGGSTGGRFVVARSA